MLEFREISSSSQSKTTFVIILALVLSFYFLSLYSSNQVSYVARLNLFKKCKLKMMNHKIIYYFSIKFSPLILF